MIGQIGPVFQENYREHRIVTIFPTFFFMEFVSLDLAPAVHRLTRQALKAGDFQGLVRV